jgi:hypothetical protein
MKIGIFVVFGAVLGLSGCSVDAGAGDGSGGDSNAGTGGKANAAGASFGGSAGSTSVAGGGAMSGGAGGSTSGGGGGSTSGGAGGGSSVNPENSPECTAFCNKLQTMCSYECDKSFDCSIDSGQCAESTIAFLKCVAEKGQISCGADGYSVIGCSHDKTLCK